MGKNTLRWRNEFKKYTGESESVLRFGEFNFKIPRLINTG